MFWIENVGVCGGPGGAGAPDDIQSGKELHISTDSLQEILTFLDRCTN